MKTRSFIAVLESAHKTKGISFFFRSDIFNLFDLVMILSRGRMVYFGKASEMVEYFTGIEYPCPHLTNPCDYYGKMRKRKRSDSVL